jgi:hypothetical protein
VEVFVVSVCLTKNGPIDDKTGFRRDAAADKIFTSLACSWETVDKVFTKVFKPLGWATVSPARSSTSLGHGAPYDGQGLSRQLGGVSPTSSS